MNALQLSHRHCLNLLRDYITAIPSYLEGDVTDKTILEAIKLKEERIFKSAKYWVTMNDKGMSGWGMATNKVNKLIIACDSYKDAQLIQDNAERRPEMKYINICCNKPQIKKHVYPSWKHFEDMGEIWKK